VHAIVCSQFSVFIGRWPDPQPKGSTGQLPSRYFERQFQSDKNLLVAIIFTPRKYQLIAYLTVAPASVRKLSLQSV